MIAMHKNRHFPDVIGLFVLVILVAILSAFVPASEIPPSLWVPICAAWAVSAIFMWRKVGPETKPWRLIGLYSVGGAVVWYAATRAISRWTFGTDEAELSKVVDLLLALILSPGLTFVAIAGWVRAFIRQKRS
ncbi:hypothetical protein [Burkholderia sp. D-99]|uniref:hypothetical protein n=1 Tax=Burkholderia sp. D-99 TaxID=2717316 RepID=UPI0014206688|nr:hypothetical protein [Burkholderia sp. D-99]NHV26857.1 hypothetical protein [Burkholderia sp. D-99]